MKVITRDMRPRPLLRTPAKGAEGDCTDETMVDGCDIGRIIQRYGGNLAELARWRGSMSFGEQVNHNLEDNIERFRELEGQLKDLPNCPFATLNDAFDAIADGTFIEKITPKFENENKERKNEEKPSVKAPVEENLPADGQ